MKKPAEIILNAIDTLSLNQEGFSKIINKTQGTVSRYISGIQEPPLSIIMHCMNIIENEEILIKANRISKKINSLQYTSENIEFINSLETILTQHVNSSETGE